MPENVNQGGGMKSEKNRHGLQPNADVINSVEL